MQKPLIELAAEGTVAHKLLTKLMTTLNFLANMVTPLSMFVIGIRLANINFKQLLTDSRSLLSYPRHHYFRRILCNFFGCMMEGGEMTQDEILGGEVIKDICYCNAINYLNMK